MSRRTMLSLAHAFLRAGVFAALLAFVPSPAAGGSLERWLAVEDPVERCPAIVVLNGDHPARADTAAALHEPGVEVWLTSDPRSGSGAGDDTGTRSNARRLAVRGVPDRAIRVLPGAAAGTRAELELIASELRRRHAPCAVLVTSPLHGRRVKLTWQRTVGESPRAVIRHARDAGYAGWRVALKELGLSLLALIGLPR